MNVPKDRCGFMLEPDHVVKNGAADKGAAGLLLEKTPEQWHAEFNVCCCWRTVWEDSDRCIWHATVREKTAQEIIDARSFESEPVDLSGAYLLECALGDSITLRKARLRGATLSHANLARANLASADLWRARLWDTNLEKADLSAVTLGRAYLVEANLSGADLSGANLFHADLKRADLSGGDFSEADLRGADLAGADLSCTDFTGADLSNADLSNTNLSEADLSNANLSGASLYAADVQSSDYTNPLKLVDANLSTANLKKAVLKYADFSDANLVDADLSWTYLTGANFSGGTLNGVLLSHAFLSRSNFSNADLSVSIKGSEANLSNANLRGANLSNANLRGANLSNTELIGADLSATDLRSFDKTELTDEGRFHHISVSTDLRGAHFGEAIIASARMSQGTLVGRKGWLNERRDRGDLPYEQDSLARSYHVLGEAAKENGLTGKARTLRFLERKARRKEARLNGDWSAWVGSLASWLVTGYGISIRRVTVTMLAVIIGCAWIYWGTGVGGGKFFQALEYSVQIFIGTGTTSELPNTQLVRSIVNLEAFAGLLFTMLFAYVLATREAP